MEHCMIDHPRLKVWERTGTEGPEHDPYAYRELDVSVPLGDIRLRLGSLTGIQLWFDERQITGTDSQLLEQVFPSLVGHTVEQLERISRRSREHCPGGGGHVTEDVRGFPGEHLEVCVKCNRVVDAYFGRSAVE